MNVEKVSWKNSTDQVRFTMPLSKINEELRQVSGFASLDNPDEHDDIVMAEASTRAFSRFRGNIREMHQPIAVGKMVDFVEDQYVDAKSGETYKGIYVTVKVSKGAEDTWQKVLDGTLTGFSIGGHIVDSEQVIVKNDTGQKNIRLIKEYDLEELSLVDNPANQLANIFSIQKNADGETEISGELVEKSSEIVFFCKEDGIAKTSPEDSVNCPQCGNTMTDAGWFEYTNSEEKVAKMASILSDFQKSSDEGGDSNEGGVEMKIRKSEKQAEPEKVEKQADAEEVEPVSEVTPDEEPEVIEKEVSEAGDEENELSKMMDDLKETIEKGFNENIEEVNSKVEEINKSFKELGEAMDKKFKDLESKQGELSKRIAGIKAEVDEVEKSLRVIDSRTAIKKSGDLGGSSEEVVRKDDDNVWGGAFLGTDYLNN